MNACASCAMLRRRRLAGADRPDRLVGDHERSSVAGGERRSPRPGICSTSSVSPASRSPRASRRRRRSRAGRRSSAARARRATVSSVSPKSWRRSEWPTSVAVDAELAQHRRRDLARERALGSQCTFWANDAISVPASAWTAAASETYGGQTTTSTSPRSASRSVAAERRRLRRALEHLPVAGDQHRRLTVLPGSPPRRAAPCPRAARARRRRRSRSTRCGRRRPASWTARTESPPPTTV